MNIWILNHYAITPDMPGGTRHYDLGRELVQLGHKVTIFASSFHYSLRQEMRLANGAPWSIDTVDGVTFVWLRTFPYQKNDWRRIVSMANYASKAYFAGRDSRCIEDAPNVIIGSSVHLLAVVSAYGLARHYGAHFVMEVRDLWPQTLVDVGALRDNHFLVLAMRVLEKFLYQRSERIIVLQPGAGEYIGRQGIDPNRVIWIPNGVDLSRFSAAEMPEKSSKEFSLIYLGAHGQNNALDVILRAAKVVQEAGYGQIRFTFIGEGPEKQRLIDLAEGLELHNVEFRPSVPKTAVGSVLQQADATILALHDLSLYKYGISLNKLSDYLAATKPVILVGSPAHNPVENADCGICVSQHDPIAVGRAVIEMWALPSTERQAMGERGREFVAKHYSWGILAKELEDSLGVL